MSIVSEARNLHFKIATAFPLLSVSEYQCRSLITRARRLHKMYERQCSEDMGIRAAAFVRSINAEEQDLAAFLAKLGIKGETQRDPRGFPVKLHVPAGMGNDWGGDHLYGIGL